MEQKHKLQLSALELSDRMRSYKTRPLQRVQPRCDANHLRRRVGMDVWEPTSILAVSQPQPMVKQVQLQDNAKKLQPSKISVHQNGTKLPATSSSKSSKVPSKNNNSNVIQHRNQPTAINQRNFSVPTKEKKIAKKFKLFSFSKPTFANYALYGMAVMLFLVGVVVAYRSFMLDNKIAQSVSAQAVNDPTNPDNVDENKPSDKEVGSYQVAPDLPRTVLIPKLRVNSRVRQMTVDKDGSLDAPKNIHDAGWYNDSAKPGSPGGAMLLDGHVSGPTQKGVFYKLETLQKDDIVTVERGDGKKIDYKVVKVEVKKATDLDMSQMLLPVVSGKHGLNLITCTGKFNASTKTFEDRALVFAQVDRVY